MVGAAVAGAGEGCRPVGAWIFIRDTATRGSRPELYDVTASRLRRSPFGRTLLADARRQAMIWTCVS